MIQYMSIIFFSMIMACFGFVCMSVSACVCIWHSWNDFQLKFNIEYTNANESIMNYMPAKGYSDIYIQILQHKFTFAYTNIHTNEENYIHHPYFSQLCTGRQA